MTEVSLLVTLLGFLLGAELQKRVKHPLCNPTLISTLGVLLYLWIGQLSYAQYQIHTRSIALLLGPAVVALAVPLHQQSGLLKKHFRSIAVGFLTGGVLVLGAATVLGHLLQLAPEPQAALTTMSSTSAISYATHQKLGFSGSLAAVVSIWTGIMGALLLPRWLSLLGIRDPVARGLTIGTLAHGIGTAQMVGEGELQTAVSSLGMGLNGLMTALLVPLLWRLLQG